MTRMQLTMTLGPARQMFVVIHQVLDFPDKIAAYPFEQYRDASLYMDYLISKGCMVGALFQADLALEPLRQFDYTELPPPNISA